MKTRVLGTGMIATLLVTLSACGSSSGGGGTTATTADKQGAALAWAQCMRDHGVDMADPEIDAEGHMRVQMRGGPGADAEAASKACASLQAKIGGGDASPQQRQEDEQAMLEFAQCMRAHGQDVPDPKPGEGIRINKPRDDAGFQAAQEACQSKLPGGMQ
jgi:hypothetical protein